MLPHYYSSLRPFAKTFREGMPVLTYHKLGPRPPRVRLKGLYVSESLFQHQLQELRDAGFRFGTLYEIASGTAQPGSVVVVTFDDGFRNVREHGLETIRSLGVPAIQFLLPDLLGRTNDWEQQEGEAPEPLMDAAEVRDWLAAGQEIGSHTCTHPWLTRIPVDQAREEIAASRKKLEDRFQVPVRHFCYPYGDWNEAVRDLVAEAGYVTACTTEPGVNRSADDRLSIKRFTARYPSRNLKNLWQRLTTG
jgi:peptidoglycan/xylan/chitin deacetylase (PgdA/CDA1 family)